MIRTIIFFLLFATLSEAAGLRLENDGCLPLTVMIQGADGSIAGELSLAPGESTSWTDTDPMAIKKKPRSKSITPLTVYWYCSEGGLFSVSDQISTGALVKARDGVGKKSCPSAKKENQELPP